MSSLYAYIYSNIPYRRKLLLSYKLISLSPPPLFHLQFLSITPILYPFYSIQTDIKISLKKKKKKTSDRIVDSAGHVTRGEKNFSTRRFSRAFASTRFISFSVSIPRCTTAPCTTFLSRNPLLPVGQHVIHLPSALLSFP